MMSPRTRLGATTGAVLATAAITIAVPVAPAVAAGSCITAVVLPKAQEWAPYQGHVTTSYTGTGRLNMTASGLPAGLTMSTGGYLSGTPSTAGVFNVTFSLGLGGCGVQTLPLTVTADQRAVASFWGADGAVASDSPVDIPGLSDVTGVSVEGHTSIFLKGDGTVWTWSSWNPQTARDLAVTAAPAPVQVTGLTGITQVAGSGQVAYGAPYALALRNDGTVWVWGKTITGQTANGQYTSTTYTTPTQVTGLQDVVAVSTDNDYKWALTSDGRVWGWGYDEDDTLGDPTGVVTTPAPVPGMTGIVAISADAEIGYGIRQDGTVLAKGSEVQYQFGLNGEPAGDIVTVPGLSGVTALVAGDQTEHALAAGRVWSWGQNDGGQVGDGTVGLYVQYPTVAAGLTGVTAIGADRFTTYAIVGSNMYAWGDDLANGAFDYPTPVLSSVKYAIATSGDAAAHLPVLRKPAVHR